MKVSPETKTAFVIVFLAFTIFLVGFMAGYVVGIV